MAYEETGTSEATSPCRAYGNRSALQLASLSISAQRSPSYERKFQQTIFPGLQKKLLYQLNYQQNIPKGHNLVCSIGICSLHFSRAEITTYTRKGWGFQGWCCNSWAGASGYFWPCSELQESSLCLSPTTLSLLKLLRALFSPTY